MATFPQNDLQDCAYQVYIEENKLNNIEDREINLGQGYKISSILRDLQYIDTEKCSASFKTENENDEKKIISTICPAKLFITDQQLESQTILDKFLTDDSSNVIIITKIGVPLSTYLDSKDDLTPMKLAELSKQILRNIQQAHEKGICKKE